MPDDKFLDVKARAFHNKKNGQLLITLPKKRMKKLFGDHDLDAIPKHIPIRIFDWKENK